MGEWESLGAQLRAVAPPATTSAAVGASSVPPLLEAQYARRLSLRSKAARTWTFGALGDKAWKVVGKEAAADVCVGPAMGSTGSASA